MTRCTPMSLAAVVSIAVCVGHEATHAECIDRVIVRPVGRITNADPVRLEIEVHTPSSPPIHTQPTEVSIVGDSVAVRMHIVGGPADMWGSITEYIELGVLDPRTYHYAIALNPTAEPPAFTADGSFCVEDSACAEADCRCPIRAPQYTIISLGTLGGYSSSGQAINDLGEVTGLSYVPSGRHAFLWQNDSMTDLGTLSPNDYESSGLDINNNGDVVGYSGPGRAVLWREEQVIDLGTLGLASRAYGNNDAGQIVGSSQLSPTESHAVLWQNGELIDLTATYGAPMGSALDINAVGQILGYGIRLEPDGSITELGTLGGTRTVASALNDRGQVVGSSQRGDGSNYDWHAFLWADGVMTDLGAVGSYFSSGAVDVNNSGQVVGSGSGPDPWCWRSFLYEPQKEKGFRDLRNLIPVNSGWKSLSPYGINNAGQIAGTGWFQGETGGTRAFLMTLPTAPGACCANNGSCETTLFEYCASPLWIEGTACTPNSCPPPGTCCTDNGTCIMTLEADCGLGSWTEGGLCDPNSCPQSGACCGGDGSCETTFLVDCASPLWVEGASCSPNHCPIPPIVSALGGRYLSVTPQAWDPSEMVAIRISSPRFPCLSKYVALDSGMGRVIDNPVFLPAAQWGTVYVADTEIVPATTYEVQTQSALGLSQPAGATTPMWCDVYPPLGIVNAIDIVGFVDRFKSVLGSPPLEACDVYPAVPDQIVSALDIVLAVDAFKELPYPFPLPCD